MSWTDTLHPMPDCPALFAPEPWTLGLRLGFHIRRAGLGVFAAVYLRDPQADARYTTFRAWKDGPAGQGDFLDTAAGAIVALIRQWSAVVPSDWTVTTPPAGASEGGMYPAGILAREVAARLDLDYQTTMQRAKAKRWHHPRESMTQAAYTVPVVPVAPVIVIDDFCSSGTTMRLSRAALAAAGVPSFGFVWGAD